MCTHLNETISNQPPGMPHVPAMEQMKALACAAADEEPATEEPATEEPATEEPAMEEPATEAPAEEPESGFLANYLSFSIIFICAFLKL